MKSFVRKKRDSRLKSAAESKLFESLEASATDDFYDGRVISDNPYCGIGLKTEMVEDSGINFIKWSAHKKSPYRISVTLPSGESADAVRGFYLLGDRLTAVDLSDYIDWNYDELDSKWSKSESDINNDGVIDSIDKAMFFSENKKDDLYNIRLEMLDDCYQASTWSSSFDADIKPIVLDTQGMEISKEKIVKITNSDDFEYIYYVFLDDFDDEDVDYSDFSYKYRNSIVVKPAKNLYYYAIDHEGIKTPIYKTSFPEVSEKSLLSSLFEIFVANIISVFK
jgi:hypothetical protein